MRREMGNGSTPQSRGRLVEGLSAQQSDAEYNALLDASLQSIFEASNT